MSCCIHQFPCFDSLLLFPQGVQLLGFILNKHCDELWAHSLNVLLQFQFNLCGLILFQCSKVSVPLANSINFNATQLSTSTQDVDYIMHQGVADIQCIIVHCN